ncbi:MAG TPA: phospho-N-acetylmuramoyl-pentapeptide-transferase [Candidatus Acidoferrum sp.]|nr:phospho-N-acetylmuramoyl-pentapeptide-transferase [Candidatus Acidoferrum sp.]
MDGTLAAVDLEVGAIELIQGLLLAFAVVVIVMPSYIRLLSWVGIGKKIREEGPTTHLVKQGTPTMGGLLIIIVVAVLAYVLDGLDATTYSPVAALLGVGLLGAADDFLNSKTGLGISVRQKLVWQLVVAVLAAIYIQRHFNLDGIRVPFAGEVTIGPVAYITFAAFAIIASSNGVNITDGLDGLAGGTLIFAFISYLIIAELNEPHQPKVALMCALIIGAVLGFLWFNVHPAQIIMGDSGSLALGATLAVTALVTFQILVLPLIGIIFVIETASVIIQVAYFKSTGGRRIFLMSPIHHHFELKGWDEEKITLRFWIVAILAGLLGVTFFLASIKALR